jgi:hypothetical protein
MDMAEFQEKFFGGPNLLSELNNCQGLNLFKNEGECRI